MSELINYEEKSKELADFIRGAIRHHTYVDDKTQTWLVTIVAALTDAHNYRWIHIDDELPPMGEWVLCAGYAQRENGDVYEWSGCGRRKAGHGGAWRWVFDDEDFEGEQLEFWCRIRDLPPARQFKPKPPEITET